MCSDECEAMKCKFNHHDLHTKRNEKKQNIKREQNVKFLGLLSIKPNCFLILVKQKQKIILVGIKFSHSMECLHSIYA